MSDVWRSSKIEQKIANNRTEQIPNNLIFKPVKDILNKSGTQIELGYFRNIGVL